MTDRSRGAAYLAVVVLSLIWGYNWVIIKIATVDASPFVLAALRGAVGALCLFLTLIATRRSLNSPPVGPMVIAGLLQTTGFTLFQTIAIASGGAGKAAILVYTMPFWIVLLAVPFLDERMTRTRIIVLALAFAGLAFVLAPFDPAHGVVSKLASLASAICWAASAIYIKRYRKTHDVELLSLTTWQMVYGTIPLVIAALLVPGGFLHVTWPFISAMAYIAIPGTSLAWLLWLFILARLSAGTAGVSSLLTPVIGVFAAWFQLGEQPGPAELFGLLLIVAALTLNTLPPRTRLASQR